MSTLLNTARIKGDSWEGGSCALGTISVRTKITRLLILNKDPSQAQIHNTKEYTGLGTMESVARAIIFTNPNPAVASEWRENNEALYKN